MKFTDPVASFFAACCLNGQMIDGARLAFRLKFLKEKQTQTQNPSHKFTCKYYIQIKADDPFHVIRRLFGVNGSNMKSILKEAGEVKLRLRGIGSGFKEGPGL